jgi:gas vesicle protein
MIKSIKKILFGAGIGAVLGVLFAPKKGTETRQEIQKTVDKVKETTAPHISKAKEKYPEVKEKVISKAKEVKEKVEKRLQDKDLA